MLGAELRLLLLQFAAPGVNLLQQRGGKVAAFALQVRIGGNDQLRVALRGRPVLRLAQNAVGGDGHQLAAQLIDLQQRRGVLRLARLAVGQGLRRGKDAMVALESPQPLLIQIHARLDLLQLALQPCRRLHRGLHARVRILLAIGANQTVHHGGGQCRIPGAKANLNQQGARHGLHMEPLLKTLQKVVPGPGIG